MKILILSWRDIKSPFSGGAEVFTFENAKRWVKAGHEVTWFASAVKDAPAQETIEGVHIIRRGAEITVQLRAFLCYRKLFKGKFDLILDQINTIPFFTPLYVKEKKIAIIFQLAREVWFYEAIFPISLIGYILEFIYLKLYKKIAVITISESTKQDLLGLGFTNKISVVPVGILQKLYVDTVVKDKNELSLVYLGRLRRSKRVDHIIKAVYLLKKELPGIKLKIIGSAGKPDYIKKLHKMVKKYGLTDNVCFYGYVNDQEKQQLLARAHVLVITSIREGWGLVVSEANSLSTIAIGYNVAGIRDSIADGFTGLLTKRNTALSLAQALLDFYRQRDKYAPLYKNALENSKKLTWDFSARSTLEAIDEP